MSDVIISNGDSDFLSSKLIRQRQIEDLASANEVVVTFDKLTEQEAYYLLLALKQNNAGNTIKKPRSIDLRYKCTADKVNKVLAKDQET
jgi:hypothetical protein